MIRLSSSLSDLVTDNDLLYIAFQDFACYALTPDCTVY
ncbi:hypothetical protein RintRC_5090 [Richelia intracellularis]|nr:hypothetical protein RintRC_5090 [Richelia intracellularis]